MKVVLDDTRFALVNAIPGRGVQIVTSGGSHYCIPLAEWNRMIEESWNEVCGPVFDREVLYGRRDQ